MAVYDRRWCPIRTQPVTVDDRVGGRLGNLDVLGADGSQLVGQPFGGPPTVVGMLGQCRDAGEAQEVCIGAQARIPGPFEIGLEICGRLCGSHGLSPK